MLCTQIVIFVFKVRPLRPCRHGGILAYFRGQPSIIFAGASAGSSGIAGVPFSAFAVPVRPDVFALHAEARRIMPGVWTDEHRLGRAAARAGWAGFVGRRHARKLPLIPASNNTVSD